jgi:hypothetical protein
MTPVFHCKLIRFLNPKSDESIRREVEGFFAAALKSLRVENVVRLGVKYPTEQGIEVLVGQIAELQKPAKTHGNLIAQLRKHDLTMEISNGIRTFGIRFEIEQPLNFSGCSWFYRSSPLPISEFGLLYFVDYQSPEQWAEELLASGSVHVVCMVTHWLRRSSYYGRGDNRYLRLLQIGGQRIG